MRITSEWLIQTFLPQLLQVRNAATKRDDALKELREIKSAELDLVDDQKKPNEEEIEAAIEKYREALTNELELRTIIPGVRIAAPNDPERKQEDIAAAKQFLNLDISNDVFSEVSSRKTEARNQENERSRLLLQSRRRFDGKEENVSKLEDESGLSNSSVLVLFLIGCIQILLLVVLSLDPLTANEFFTFLDGINVQVETLSEQL